MNRSSGTTSLRSRWLTSVAPLALALVATCQSPPSGDPAVSQTQPAQAETGPLRLAAPERWQRLNPDGPFLVSPRLSPDGRWVAASGRLGVGLYVVATDGSSGLQTLDVEYRGPRGWSDAPVALHFGHDEVHAWRRGGLEPGSGRRVWERPWDDDLGLCVRSDRRGSWYHHPREGTVAFEPEGASPELVVDFGAWGVVVSPTGRYAVWSTGTLREPRLWLYDVSTRRTMALGAGVHPAWFPDGAQLVFARPAGVEMLAGRGRVTGSELMLHEVVRGQTRALTSTPQMVEMQPTVAPDGRSVVFADWRTGGMYRATVRGGGTR